MSNIQISSEFCAELDSMGMLVPPYTVEVVIEMAKYDEPCVAVFKVLDIRSGTVKAVRGWEFGKGMLCSELYAKLSESMRLPDFTSNIKIVAKANEVVKIYVEAALPEGAFDFLKN